MGPISQSFVQKVSCKVALRYGEDIISSTDFMDLAAVVARKKESKCSFISVLSMVQMKRERELC